MSKVEYIGIHLKVSVQLGWTFISFVHSFFVCLAHSDESPSHRQEFLGWPYSHWTIFTLCLACSIGVIFLASYRDIYVTIMQSYGLFGIFSLNAFDRVCEGTYKEKCLNEVKLAAFILGSILLFLSFLVLVLYHKMVCNFK